MCKGTNSQVIMPGGRAKKINPAVMHSHLSCAPRVSADFFCSSPGLETIDIFLQALLIMDLSCVLFKP